MRISKEEPSSSAAQASICYLFTHNLDPDSLVPTLPFSVAGACITLIYLIEQAVGLIAAVKELQGLTALDLNKLLKDSENFTIHYLTKKGSLLKVVS